jgi:hypothetical protein
MTRKITAGSDVPVADPVLRKVKVVTFTASRPRAQSVAVKDGRVLVVATAPSWHTAPGRRAADDGRPPDFSDAILKVAWACQRPHTG